MLPCPAGDAESLEKVYKGFIRNGCTKNYEIYRYYHTEIIQ